jgi:hypothetical protein
MAANVSLSSERENRMTHNYHGTPDNSWHRDITEVIEFMLSLQGVATSGSTRLFWIQRLGFVPFIRCAK